MSNKRNEQGFGLVPVLLALVVAGMLGLSGYLVYSRNQDKKEQARLEQQVTDLQKKQNSTSTPKEEKKVLTEDEQILAAAGCKTDDPNCSIKDKEPNIAYVISGDATGGINIFVAKENGEWKSVYKGNGDVPIEIQEKYTIPTAWAEPDHPLNEEYGQ